MAVPSSQSQHCDVRHVNRYFATSLVYTVSGNISPKTEDLSRFISGPFKQIVVFFVEVKDIIVVLLFRLLGLFWLARLGFVAFLACRGAPLPLQEGSLFLTGSVGFARISSLSDLRFLERSSSSLLPVCRARALRRSSRALRSSCLWRDFSMFCIMYMASCSRRENPR